MLMSPQVSFQALCEAHGLPYSRSAYASVIALVRTLALHQPPQAALNLSVPEDAAMVANMQVCTCCSSPPP
jgi:hypothetical protein